MCILLLLVAACGGDDSEGDIAPGTQDFTLSCNLDGVAATLSIRIEAVSTSGVARGIDGLVVIPTGDVTYFTSGRLRSPVASYIFTGENNFADFTDENSLERFRVQWVPTEDGLLMVVNPFGPGPVQYACTL